MVLGCSFFMIFASDLKLTQLKPKQLPLRLCTLLCLQACRLSTTRGVYRQTDLQLPSTRRSWPSRRGKTLRRLLAASSTRADSRGSIIDQDWCVPFLSPKPEHLNQSQGGGVIPALTSDLQSADGDMWLPAVCLKPTPWEQNLCIIYCFCFWWTNKDAEMKMCWFLLT